MGATKIEELRLEVRLWEAAQLVNEPWARNGELRASVEYRLDYLAHMFRVNFRMPEQVLQDEVVHTTIPANGWEAVKWFFGLRYRAKTLKITEALCFPDVAIPKGAGEVLIRYQADVEHGYEGGTEVASD